MLTQRGYEILEDDEENIRITALKPDGQQMIVIFNSTPKFDTKSMKEVISIMNSMQVTHSLVIYSDSITTTKNTIDRMEDMCIELFAMEDLQYNITKHRLQPQFERLSQQEAEEFKKLYGAKFPIMRVDKPISKFYNYQKGDIIRITRQNGYIIYRIVK
jgi:DNA-directed RNA polymerase subunit H (RpoH/RPB5)